LESVPETTDTEGVHSKKLFTVWRHKHLAANVMVDCNCPTLPLITDDDLF